jgi:hypothetical protein
MEKGRLHRPSITRSLLRRRGQAYTDDDAVTRWSPTCAISTRSRNGRGTEPLLYAGNSLGRARAEFEHAIKHRPRIRLTIRQQTRVLEQWPRLATPPPAAE